MPVAGAYHLVTWLASTGDPLAGQLSIALAIMVFTVGVRLLLLPLSRAAARGERARAALMPRMQELRERRLLPYGTVLATAVVPLATGLYVLTTTTRSVAERVLLRGGPS